MAHLGNTIVNGALRVLGGENVDTINGVTVGTSPKFTDTNNAVTQTATTTDANYEVLFSATADNTTRTEGARKTTTLRFNPSKGALMEGDSTAASGSQSHAEGYNTKASGSQSHAEGNYTTASGVASHTEGSNTVASGAIAHAEGQSTSATNSLTHAEGSSSIASGKASHAEGNATVASGDYSHASGSGTCAAGANQTVVGKYNVADTTSLFIVGNGTANNARKNALSVASDGIVSLTGQLRTSFKSAVATGSYLPTAQTVPNLCTELRYSSGVMGSVSISTEYTKDGVTIPTGWYNFMWIPHRSGGNNGAASGDNCDYGALYLTAMTMESSFYLIRFTSGSITEVKNVLANDEYVINGGIFYDPQLSKFAKTTADGWDKQVYSRKGYKNNVYVRFKAGQTNKAIMVGLNSDPTTDANYASIDFCWYLQNNGTLAIYESGTAINTIASGTKPTYISGEEFYIEVHDNKVYYYRNNDYYSEPKLERVSTNKTTSSSSNYNKLYFDSSFHGQSGYIYDVEFGVTTQTASRILVNNEAGQGILNNFPIAVSRNMVSSTSGMQQATLQTFPYFSYCPPYHSLSVGEGASASKYEAMALGYNVEANANSSFATGEGTIANGECQTVIGKYNVADTTSLFIIGNGNASTRSNALKIDSSGNFYTNKLMLVGKESSRSTSTVGTWTAMCRSDQAGSPTLPTTSEWWNVISLNNWTDTSNNWVSQLVIATQDSQGKGVWWRTNDSAGTDISNSTWHRLAEGENNGLPKFYINKIAAGTTAWDEIISFSKLKSNHPYLTFYAGSDLNFLIINPCEKTITISLYLNNNDSRLADSEKGFAKDRLTIFELQNTGIFKYFSFSKPYLLYAMFTGNQSVTNSSYTTAMEVPYFYSNFNGYGVTADFQNGVYGSSAIINNRVNVINCYAKFQFI